VQDDVGLVVSKDACLDAAGYGTEEVVTGRLHCHCELIGGPGLDLTWCARLKNLHNMHHTRWSITGNSGPSKRANQKAR
jgi:hypothetical protein